MTDRHHFSSVLLETNHVWGWTIYSRSRIGMLLVASIRSLPSTYSTLLRSKDGIKNTLSTQHPTSQRITAVCRKDNLHAKAGAACRATDAYVFLRVYLCIVAGLRLIQFPQPRSGQSERSAWTSLSCLCSIPKRAVVSGHHTGCDKGFHWTRK